MNYTLQKRKLKISVKIDYVEREGDALHSNRAHFILVRVDKY